jgi:hypothetical protein
MRLEKDQFWTFYEWFFVNNGLMNGCAVAIALVVLGFVISYLVSMVRHGPGEGFLIVSKNIRDLFLRDLPNTTSRRTFAIARLAFKEAIRRKVLVVVGIFIVGLMFAGWYLDPESENPIRLYISFVLTTTNYLVLLLGLYLSTFSLPQDIKNKTIYTITTKPVRATEIVLGRIVGFSLIGTAILLVLGLLSYLFVIRGLSHSHQIERVATADKEGASTFDQGHSHEFNDGAVRTLEERGHYHEVIATEEGGQTVYSLGPAKWPAKVPVYGSLSFTDRDGQRGIAGDMAVGLNVGYISEYQKYIAGATLMSAIWTFDGITEDRFGDTMRLEMTLAAFRTITGDIVTPVKGSIIFRSIDGTVFSERQTFEVKEAKVDEYEISRTMNGYVDGEAKTIDLYNDLAKDENHQIEVVIRCEDTSQYLGMSQADLLLRASDNYFALNFAKGYVSIWLQMVIIVSFGVMFSTFLSGPVAFFATTATLLLGYFGSAIDLYFTDRKDSGGGIIESFIRLVTRKGSMHDLDLGNPTLEEWIKTIDVGPMNTLRLLMNTFPNFNALGTADFPAYGIDLFRDLLLRHGVITMGYVVMAFIIGYFFLKTREIAA